MARMHNPPHPGLTLRDDVLPALGLGVTQAAEQLGVSRVALSRMLNGLALTLVAMLAGCGADVAGTAATVGTMEAKQAEQAKATEAQILDKLKDAQAAGAAQAASAADGGY